MNTFKLIVSSPDGNIFEGDIIKFDVRGVEGDIGIMAGHIPFVTSIVEGGCSVWMPDDTIKKAHASGGLLTVDTDKVTLLSGSFMFIE